jgi:hypothetical protein
MRTREWWSRPLLLQNQNHHGGPFGAPVITMDHNQVQDIVSGHGAVVNPTDAIIAIIADID